MKRWVVILGLGIAAILATQIVLRQFQNAPPYPSSVELYVRSDGSADFNHTHFSDLSQLQAELAKLCAQNQKPGLRVREDQNIAFEKVGRVIAVAQKANCLRVGFLTQPPQELAPK